MDSHSPNLYKHQYPSTAAGTALRRPHLPRGLAIKRNSSSSLLTCLPSPVRMVGDKSLPPRPISNLRDYMPPAASRSSWSGMPFAQFERRLLHFDKLGDEPDVTELQAFLTSRIEEMNRQRAMLGLAAWKVPVHDILLMRHVCKLWWGEEVKIPEVKKTGIGRDVKYEIDYESMATARELEDILLNQPLFEIGTKGELAEAEEAKKAEEKRVAEHIALIKKSHKRRRALERRERKKSSAFVGFWGNIGHVLGLSIRKSRRDSNGLSVRNRRRTRLIVRVFRPRPTSGTSDIDISSSVAVSNRIAFPLFQP
ncbi:hypothetical protein EV361DRAFT_953728 [Lentinula raphanica]|uniref:Uncharacterized protein n=1 Tax=Lentinula raphanica TaxID=153919 RepID=A0AA38PL57_9AGAR|nr:hypothetical protein F5878DRAFT_655665 [Lentinula raphanica]KAJ3966856.1 hypothetical protein EV361DRAFT_953728 [Lentinula raphanica]